jgi:putative sterol carrier protein
MSTRYAKLKPILKPAGKKVSTTELTESVKGLAGTLEKGREVGRLALSILDGRQRHSYAIELVRGRSTVATNPEGRSDLQIACRKDTYVQIVSGELSPADAFLTGRLEVHGNLGFAKRVYARAARGGLGDLAKFGD